MPSLARVTYTLTIFLSAFLLFAIQPMFTKMVLPQLGGSPGVWSVAMVFFQALLLFGYFYAHLSAKYLSTRVSIVLHLVLLAFTFMTLPIAVSTRLGRPPVEGQIPWLLELFGLSVGLPFFAVSGNGPLLQAWFSRTKDNAAHNPYFLYAASNLGSFAALLLYPLLFEITLRLPQQTWAWSAGFAILAAMIAASGFTTLRSSAPVGQMGKPVPLSSRQVVATIALSFIPSALLVAVTSHISTDIASAPFIWIVPLALYLLTFTLTFRDRPWVPMGFVNQAVPILTGLVAFSYIYPFNLFASILIHLGFFLAAALMCHRRLYAGRPAAEDLTVFYLWMSFGGMLGGIFSGLLAPLIFNSVLEYPILASLVMLAHPAIAATSRTAMLRHASATTALAGAATLGIFAAAKWNLPYADRIAVLAAAVGVCLVVGAFRHNIIRACVLPFTFAALAVHFSFADAAVYLRSFFGVNRISYAEDGQFRILAHGTTVHGAMRIANADGTPYNGPAVPLTYYHPNGVLAETLKLLPDSATGRDIGLIGLGTGAHVCNGKTGDRFTYFEIDSIVARIATDPNLFKFISACAPHANITLGDARITMADTQQIFDYILVDAFSSDSIPAHLLTREALKIYMAHLKPQGLLVFHLSNRHVELDSVVAALAQDANLAARSKLLVTDAKSYAEPISSSVTVLASADQYIQAFSADRHWRMAQPRGTAVWTDDYSNIPAAIWRKHFGSGN